MNPAHLHLMLIHFPVASAFLAVPLLALALWRRAEQGATFAAVLVLAVGAGGAIAAVNTGEGAEEVVEDRPGVTEGAIHEHEERAETAMVISIVTAVIGIAGAGLAVTKRGSLATAALGAALVADLATAGAMAWTANAGGAIRHPEIQDGASLTEGGGAGLAEGVWSGGAGRGDNDGDDD